MRRYGFVFIVLGLLLGLLIAVTTAAGSGHKGPPAKHGKGHAKGHAKAASNHAVRWDIIHLSNLPPPTTTLSGGSASACAASSCANMITFTGSGTFRSNPGRPQDVTGGGTWTAVGFGAGSGTYKVTGFVSFEKLDLAYVERCEHSGGLALAWYDLGILRRTLVTMLRGQGLSY